MAKVTIAAVKRTPRTSQRTGKPFVSLGIKTNEHGDRWLSGFGGKDNEHWMVGNVVDVEIEDTGKYLNFTAIKAQPDNKFGVSAAEVKNMINLKVMPKLDTIETLLLRILKEDTTSDGKPFPDFSRPPSEPDEFPGWGDEPQE